MNKNSVLCLFFIRMKVITFWELYFNSISLFPKPLPKPRPPLYPSLTIEKCFLIGLAPQVYLNRTLSLQNNFSETHSWTRHLLLKHYFYTTHKMAPKSLSPGSCLLLQPCLHTSLAWLLLPSQIYLVSVSLLCHVSAFSGCFLMMPLITGMVFPISN